MERLLEARDLLAGTEGLTHKQWLPREKDQMRALLVWSVGEIERLESRLDAYVRSNLACTCGEAVSQ